MTAATKAAPADRTPLAAWEKWDTGGNCTALGRKYPGLGDWLMTRVNEPSAPAINQRAQVSFCIEGYCEQAATLTGKPLDLADDVEQIMGLVKRFSALVRNHLTPVQLAAVRAANAKDPEGLRGCESYTYIDTNVILASAERGATIARTIAQVTGYRLGDVSACLPSKARALAPVIALATQFSRLMRGALTVAQIAAVRAENKKRQADGDVSSCATHDYLDANEVMAEAFERAVGRAIKLDDDADLALWNEAWEIALLTEYTLGGTEAFSVALLLARNTLGARGGCTAQERDHALLEIDAAIKLIGPR